MNDKGDDVKEVFLVPRGVKQNNLRRPKKTANVRVIFLRGSRGPKSYSAPEALMAMLRSRCLTIQITLISKLVVQFVLG